MKKFLALLLAALLGIMPALAEESSPLANDKRTVTDITVSVPDLGDFKLAVSKQEGDYAHLIVDLFMGDQLLANVGGMMDAAPSVLYVWSNLLLDRPAAFDAEDRNMLLSQVQGFSSQLTDSSLSSLEAKAPKLAALLKSGDFSSLIDPETGMPDLNAIADLFDLKLDQIDPTALLGVLTTAFTMESGELEGIEVPGGAVAVAETVVTVTGENVAAVLTALADFVEANKEALGVFGDDQLISSLRGVQVDANSSFVYSIGMTAEGMPAYMTAKIDVGGVNETLAATFSFGDENVVTYRGVMDLPEQGELPIMEYIMTFSETGLHLDLTGTLIDTNAELSVGEPVNELATLHLLLDGKNVDENTVEMNARVEISGDEPAVFIGKLTASNTDAGCSAVLTVYPEGNEDQTITVTVEPVEAEPIIAVVDGGEIDYPCKMSEEELNEWLGNLLMRVAPVLGLFGSTEEYDSEFDSDFDSDFEIEPETEPAA